MITTTLSPSRLGLPVSADLFEPVPYRDTIPGALEAMGEPWMAAPAHANAPRYAVTIKFTNGTRKLAKDVVRDFSFSAGRDAYRAYRVANGALHIVLVSEIAYAQTEQQIALAFL